MTTFIPGLELNKQFYTSAIKPILEKNFPKVNFSAARIGYGSDVLGYDTERSMDHDWGPRLELFPAEKNYDRYKDELKEKLAEELPETFKGFSTHYGEADNKGVRVFATANGDMINHRIEIYTVKSFFEKLLGKNPFKVLTDIDWLTFPEQRLLAITSGIVYHDGLQELEVARKRFNYYPLNVWLYLLKTQWAILAEEHPFLGRVAEIGDEIGLQLLLSSQIRKIMKLCFLLEKKYAPYNKWFSKAFSKLSSSEQLLPIMKDIFSTSDWSQQEKLLMEIYYKVAKIHNDQKITEPIVVKTNAFFDRPYLTINFNDFIEKIGEKISNNSPLKEFQLGSINQLTNETYVLEDLKLIQSLYKEFKLEKC